MAATSAEASEDERRGREDDEKDGALVRAEKLGDGASEVVEEEHGARRDAGDGHAAEGVLQSGVAPDAESQILEEIERHSREASERQAREELERKAREDAERKAHEEAERSREAERQARERQAREEAQRRMSQAAAREETERRAHEAARAEAEKEALRALRAERPRELQLAVRHLGGHTVRLRATAAWTILEVLRAVAHAIARPAVLESGRLVRRRGDGSLESLADRDRLSALAEGDEVLLMNAALEPNLGAVSDEDPLAWPPLSLRGREPSLCRGRVTSRSGRDRLSLACRSGAARVQPAAWAPIRAHADSQALPHLESDPRSSASPGQGSVWRQRRPGIWPRTNASTPTARIERSSFRRTSAGCGPRSPWMGAPCAPPSTSNVGPTARIVSPMGGWRLRFASIGTSTHRVKRGLPGGRGEAASAGVRRCSAGAEERGEGGGAGLRARRRRGEIHPYRAPPNRPGSHLHASSKFARWGVTSSRMPTPGVLDVSRHSRERVGERGGIVYAHRLDHCAGSATLLGLL